MTPPEVPSDGPLLADAAYAALRKAYFSDEPDERGLLDRLAPLFARSRFFVDVGASLGQFTLAASRQMSGGRVVAVEADPGRFERLRGHCDEWARTSACALRAVHAAVTDVDGDLTFLTTDSNVSGGLFAHDLSHVRAAGPQEVHWREVRVPAFRLDTIVAEDIPDLVKIDVEGAELRVLRGAARLLADGRTRFVVELHPWPDPGGQRGPEEVVHYMRSHGYRGIPFAGKTLFVNRIPLAERAGLRVSSIAERGMRKLRRLAGRAARW